MIALFKQKSPANLVVLLIFGILIKMPMFLHPHAVQVTQADGPLYRLFMNSLGLAGPASITAALLSFFLLYCQALMVNYLVNEHRLTVRQSFLPAMAYMLLTSLWPDWNQMSAPLLAAPLIIWALIKLFHLYNQKAVKGAVYNIGLLLGLATFIFFPTAVFVLGFLLGIIILRPFQLNELILLLLGGLTPYYFYGVYLFLNDQLKLSAVFPPVLVEVPVVQQTIWLLLAAAFISLPFFVGAYQVQLQLRKMLIQVRKNWGIVLIFLLLALFIPFVNSNDAFYDWVLAVPFVAAFHAPAYLYPKKKWVPLVLFWATLAFILVQQYATANWQ